MTRLNSFIVFKKYFTIKLFFLLIVGYFLFIPSEETKAATTLCANSPCSISEGDEFSYRYGNAIEKDNTYSLSAAPLGMSVNSRTGVITWTPTNGQSGQYAVGILKNAVQVSQIVVNVQDVPAYSSGTPTDAVRVFFIAPDELTSTDMDGTITKPYSFTKIQNKLCKYYAVSSSSNPAGWVGPSEMKIFFRGGTYTHLNYDSLDPDGFPSITCSGLSLAQPVTIKPWGNEQALIKFSALQGVSIAGNYVNFEGFELEGVSKSITYDQALANWWIGSKRFNGNGIVVDGYGVTVRNNVVHDAPAAGINTGPNADLLTIEGNVVFNSSWWSVKGTTGIGLVDISNKVALPSGREKGVIARNNLVFSSESRVYSRVFTKGYSNLSIDEGSSMLIKSGADPLTMQTLDYSKGFLIENNFFLWNGKGASLRHYDIVLRNNTFYGNGTTIEKPGGAALRSNSGMNLTINHNAFEVPIGHNAIDFSDDTTLVSCSNNLNKGLYRFTTSSSNNCANGNAGNITQETTIFQNPTQNNFTPMVNGLVNTTYGAPVAVFTALKKRVEDLGFTIAPTQYLQDKSYPEYIVNQRKSIIQSIPVGYTSRVFKRGTTVVNVPQSYEDYAAITSVSLVYPDTTNPTGNKNYTMELPTVHAYSITSQVSPAGTGSVQCSANSAQIGDSSLCTATPNAGYQLVSWSGDCTGTTCYLTDIQSNKTVTANFALINATTPVSGVTLDKTTLSLATGTSDTLLATVNPANATNKAVTWTSSNPQVATVDATGLVKAVGAGTATITVSTVDGAKTATSVVTVSPATIAVDGVTVDKTVLSLATGSSANLVATVSPANATNPTVMWSSSNGAVASVDANGKVTALAKGSATITVTTSEGNFKATTTVNVTIPVKKISFSIQLAPGGKVALSGIVNPANAPAQMLKWTSSNLNVATVSSKGVVTANDVGTTVITVTTSDDAVKATISVKVVNSTIAVSGVTLDKTSMKLAPTATGTLVATLNPANATNKTVTWTSSNNAIATVDQSGKVTAVASGSATITVTTLNGNYKATATVTVSKPVTKVAISIKLMQGSKLTLAGMVNQSKVSSSSLTWTSSNPSIVSVSPTGVVTAISPGTAVITAVNGDGTFKATVKMSVASNALSIADQIYAQLEQRNTQFTMDYQNGINYTTALNEAIERNQYLKYNLDTTKFETVNVNGATKINFTIAYRESKAQYDYVTTRTNEILQQVMKPGMTVHEKTKAIHDWIVLNVAYDASLQKFTAYEALANGKAVCQGYSLLTYQLLNAAGIKVSLVTGDVTNGPHMWNMVQLEGKWYHLDTTFDDPIPDQPGKVNYNYYFVTDAYIKQNHTWTMATPAALTRYYDELNRLVIDNPNQATVYQTLLKDLQLIYLNPEYQVTKAEQLVSLIQKQTIPSNPVVFVAPKAQLSSIITGALASVTWSSYDYSMVPYPLGDEPTAVLVNLTVVQ